MKSNNFKEHEKVFAKSEKRQIPKEIYSFPQIGSSLQISSIQ